jgi:hypothetical protein
MNKIIYKIPGFPDMGMVPGFQNQQPISVSGLEGVASPNLKIIVWTVLSIILVALVIGFFLKRNKNNVKK